MPNPSNNTGRNEIRVLTSQRNQENRIPHGSQDAKKDASSNLSFDCQLFFTVPFNKKKKKTKLLDKITLCLFWKDIGACLYVSAWEGQGEIVVS